MFKNRVIIFSLIIICLAAGAYFFSNKGKGQKGLNQFHSFINPENIVKIKIAKEGKTLGLIPHDNRWFITDNNSMEIVADTGKILSVFEFINDSSIVQRITRKESAYPSFNVTDSEAVNIIFYDKTGGEQIFYIGKEKDYSSHFVRIKGDPYVYLVSKRGNFSLDKDTWFYKKILNYDFDALDYIKYSCDKNRTLKINYDKGKDKFRIDETPADKQEKDIDKLKDDFTNISITKYLPRAEKTDTKPVITHSLCFKTGENIIIGFLKSTDEKSSKHYVDIKVEANDTQDKDIKYIKSVSDKYLFELSWFDKKKYNRGCDDFFTEKAKEGADAVVSDNKTSGNETPVTDKKKSKHKQP
jgi:hypothetical protein